MEQLIFPITKREAEKQGISYSSSANKDALFPSRLRALRNEKGVSQLELSKVLGVSKSTVGLWETGDTLPDAESLYNIARYFDVSADWLLCTTDTKSVDIDIRGICAITGLDENAIETLKFYKDDNETSWSRTALILSALLCSKELYKAVRYLSDAIEFIKYLRTPRDPHTLYGNGEDQTYLEILEKQGMFDKPDILQQIGRIILTSGEAAEYCTFQAKEELQKAIDDIFAISTFEPEAQD